MVFPDLSLSLGVWEEVGSARECWKYPTTPLWGGLSGASQWWDWCWPRPFPIAQDRPLQRLTEPSSYMKVSGTLVLERSVGKQRPEKNPCRSSREQGEKKDREVVYIEHYLPQNICICWVYTCTQTRICTRIHAHACTRTHMHTRAGMHIHVHARRCIHTRTCTHTQSPDVSFSLQACLFSFPLMFSFGFLYTKWPMEIMAP